MGSWAAGQHGQLLLVFYDQISANQRNLREDLNCFFPADSADQRGNRNADPITRNSEPVTRN